MNNKDIFRILDNSDDETLEEISKKYSSVDKIYIDKIYKMTEKNFNSINSITGNEVSGVEEYKKHLTPQIAFTVSASIAVAVGLTFGLWGNIKNTTPLPQDNSQSELVEPMTELVTSTTTSSKETTLNTTTTVSTPVTTTCVNTTATSILSTSTTSTVTSLATITTVTTTTTTTSTEPEYLETLPPYYEETVAYTDEIIENTEEQPENIPTDTEPAPTTEQITPIDYNAIAENISENYVDFLYTFNVHGKYDYNKNITFKSKITYLDGTVNNDFIETYSLVTDERFSNTDDLKNYAYSIVT